MKRNTIKEMKEILDAVEQGKIVQWYKGFNGEWIDSNTGGHPNFSDFKYRIKPEEEETLLTNRELSRWLAQGNGEAHFKNGVAVSSYLTYPYEDVDKPCDDFYEIRKWTDTEWHKPTREYAFGEEDA